MLVLEVAPWEEAHLRPECSEQDSLVRVLLPSTLPPSLTSFPLEEIRPDRRHRLRHLGLLVGDPAVVAHSRRSSVPREGQRDVG